MLSELPSLAELHYYERLVMHIFETAALLNFSDYDLSRPWILKIMAKRLALGRRGAEEDILTYLCTLAEDFGEHPLPLRDLELAAGYQDYCDFRSRGEKDRLNRDRRRSAPPSPDPPRNGR